MALDGIIYTRDLITIGTVMALRGLTEAQLSFLLHFPYSSSPLGRITGASSAGRRNAGFQPKSNHHGSVSCQERHCQSHRYKSVIWDSVLADSLPGLHYGVRGEGLWTVPSEADMAPICILSALPPGVPPPAAASSVGSLRVHPTPISSFSQSQRCACR